MKKLFMFGVVGILLCLPLAAADKIFPYPLYKSSLDNGLHVVTVPFDSPGIVSFFVVVRVGSREEIEPGVTGFAHFFEHCMFRGTERFPKEKYNQTLQEIAAAGNANTWLDRTLYYFTGNADELETMFDIESDRFRYLKYAEHDFKTEAGAVLGEYTKNFASPFRRINEKMADTAFDNHTYKHTTMGFIDDIKDMPNQYEYSLKFYDRFYRPEYCTVMVVGDTTHDRVMELTKKYFGDWERGGYVPEIPDEPEQTAERRAHVQVPGGVNMLAMGYKSPAFDDSGKEKISLDLLLEIGFSNKSDIYKKLVQNEQKVRFIGTQTFDTRDPYLVTLVAQPFKAEDIAYVRDEIEKVIEHYQNTPVAEKDLADLKSRFKYGMAASFNTPFNVGNTLAYYIWLSGDPESLNRVFAIQDTVTPEDLMAAAKKYLRKEKRTIVTLSAEEESP